MSSGSGNYESDAQKEDLSDDSDLQKIKILTKEKQTKKQVQIDLDRIKKHATVGRSKHKDSQTHVGLIYEKKDETNILKHEKMAQYEAIKTGKLDLYKRA